MRSTLLRGLLRRGLKLQPLAYQYNGLGNLRLKRRGAAGAEEAARLLRGAIAQERSAAGCGAAPMEHAYRFNLGNAKRLVYVVRAVVDHEWLYGEIDEDFVDACRRMRMYGSPAATRAALTPAAPPRPRRSPRRSPPC